MTDPKVVRFETAVDAMLDAVRVTVMTTVNEVLTITHPNGFTREQRTKLGADLAVQWMSEDLGRLYLARLLSEMHTVVQETKPIPSLTVTKGGGVIKGTLPCWHDANHIDVFTGDEENTVRHVYCAACWNEVPV